MGPDTSDSDQDPAVADEEQTQPDGRRDGGSLDSARSLFGLRRRHWYAILFIGPAALVILGVLVYPVAYNLFLSVHSFSLTQLQRGRDFVGLSNYASALTDPHFWNAVKNSLIVTFSGLAVELPLGMALALAMHRRVRGSSVFRFIILLPLILVPAVVAYMWRFLFQFEGVINFLIESLGFEPLNWTTATLGLFTIVVVVAWQNTPFAFIVFLAGLQSINPDLEQAAMVDGANAWQRFRRITLPLMKPFLLIVLAIRTMDLLRLFDEPFVLTGGGPGRSTELLSQLVYTNSFRFFDMGRGAALSLLETVIIIAFLVIYFVRLRPEEEIHGRK